MNYHFFYLSLNNVKNRLFLQSGALKLKKNIINLNIPNNMC